MLQTFKKISFVCAVLGLLGFAVIWLTGTAYPNFMFQILAPVSLLLVFAALPFMLVSWILTIRKEIQAKNYLIAALWGISGLLLVAFEFRRILQ